MYIYILCLLSIWIQQATTTHLSGKDWTRDIVQVKREKCFLAGKQVWIEFASVALIHSLWGVHVILCQHQTLRCLTFWFCQPADSHGRNEEQPIETNSQSKRTANLKGNVFFWIPYSSKSTFISGGPQMIKVLESAWASWSRVICWI